MAMLEDLEARVAALEAAQADYRAVLAAVNALGANQREHSLGVATLGTQVTALNTRITALETRVDDGFHLTEARLRSLDEHLAEIKDLIVGRRDG